MFCGSPEHFIRDCPHVEDYIRERKIVRNGQGKITLPGGRFPPHVLGSISIHERVDHFYRTQGNPRRDEPAQVHFLEGTDETVFLIEAEQVSGPHSESSISNDAFSQAQIIEAQIQSLRDAQILLLQKKKEKFDGVQVPGRDIPASKNNEGPSTKVPTIHTRPAPPHVTKSARQQEKSKEASTSHRGSSPELPQGPMRPVEFPTKPPADQGKFKYQASIETSVRVGDLLDKVLDAPVTISSRELIAASSDVRRHLRDRSRRETRER